MIDIQNMKRPELQQLCKQYGVKANQKTEALREALLPFISESDSKSDSTISPSSDNTSSDMMDTDIMPAERTASPKNKNRKSSTAMNSPAHQFSLVAAANSSTDLAPKTSTQVTPKSLSKVRPVKDWSAVHKAQFDKMVSVKQDLERKEELNRSFHLSTPKSTYKEKSQPLVGVTVPILIDQDIQINSPIAMTAFRQISKSSRHSLASPTISSLNKASLIKTTATLQLQKMKSPSVASALSGNPVNSKVMSSANVAKSSTTLSNVTNATSRPVSYKPYKGALKPLGAYKSTTIVKTQENSVPSQATSAMRQNIKSVNVPTVPQLTSIRKAAIIQEQKERRRSSFNANRPGLAI